MSKVITFSRQFPKYHPKAGELTHFVEKILTGLGIFPSHITDLPDGLEVETYFVITHNFIPKYHTIRAGHRWKVGDKFSPRVWSGKPYNSKQIIIAPDIQIKSTWHFAIYDGVIVLDGVPLEHDSNIEMIANNDGLRLQDFYDWFQYPKQFNGQIICWNNDINY